MRTLGIFVDNKHFARGFNRSGEFTINEARILEQHGRVMQGLLDGSLKAENGEEKAFLQAMSKEDNCDNAYANCWKKYLTKTQRKRTYTLCSSVKSSANDDEEAESIDLDEDTMLMAE